MNSWGNCNGATQNFNVDLTTDTLKYHHVIDVYLDSMFGTYAFVDKTAESAAASSTPASTITGIIKDPTGRPLGYQRINVTFANGVTRTLFSDAQGNYTITAPPAGAMTITSGDLSQTATVVTGKPLTVALTVKNPAVKLPVPTYKVLPR